jgi:hypothetical protein
MARHAQLQLHTHVCAQPSTLQRGATLVVVILVCCVVIVLCCLSSLYSHHTVILKLPLPTLLPNALNTSLSQPHRHARQRQIERRRSSRSKVAARTGARGCRVPKSHPAVPNHQFGCDVSRAASAKQWDTFRLSAYRRIPPRVAR